MPKPASTRSAYKMLTCIYLCRTLLFFAPYADFYGKNFKTILNECRVREACIRLGDTERYGNITIQGIYESLGYRSASSFNRAFRLVTGMSPSAFLKQAQVEEV